MRVRWNKQSKEQLIRAASYIRHEFGQESMNDFMAEMKRTNRLLEKNPHLGPVEPLLSDLPSNYRSIVVCSYNKIVYRIVDKHIEVTALWDTRREPNHQIEQTINQHPNK